MKLRQARKVAKHYYRRPSEQLMAAAKRLFRATRYVYGDVGQNSRHSVDKAEWDNDSMFGLLALLGQDKAFLGGCRRMSAPLALIRDHQAELAAVEAS